jgi:adenosylhomocysteine nucleosidase
MPDILLISATKLEHLDKEIGGIPIHIVGIGKVEAALNTYKLIKEHKPSRVINFGSCGNLKDHKVGDILEIAEVYDDFYGCVVPEHNPIMLKYVGYKLFTTDTFYDKENTYSDYYSRMVKECDVVDMEGYSIAKVCMEEKVSLSLYKWVSDDGSSQDWAANAAVGYNNFKNQLLEWLERQK